MSHPQPASEQAVAPSAREGDGTEQNDVKVGMSRSDRWISVFLATTLVLLMGIHWYRLSGTALEPVAIDRLPDRQLEYRVKINSATWIEFAQLERIGVNISKRIVEDREANGPFESIEALQRVKGIGPKTIERIRPWLQVDMPDE